MFVINLLSLKIKYVFFILYLLYIDFYLSIIEVITMIKQIFKLHNFIFIRLTVFFIYSIITIFLYYVFLKIFTIILPLGILNTFLSVIGLFLIMIPIISIFEKVILNNIELVQLYYLRNNTGLTLKDTAKNFKDVLFESFSNFNFYLNLFSNLNAVNRILREDLCSISASDIKPYFRYSFLFEFRSNFIFKFIFDTISNNLITSVLFYNVKMDSELDIKDYAKGIIFYHRIFYRLLQNSLKGIVLLNFLAMTLYSLIYIIIIFNSSNILGSIGITTLLLIIFYKFFFKFILNNYVIYILYDLCASNISETNDVNDEPEISTNEVEELNNDIPNLEYKQNLSDIPFSINKNKLFEQHSKDTTDLSILLNKWKTNVTNNTDNDKDKGTHNKAEHTVFVFDKTELQKAYETKSNKYNDNIDSTYIEGDISKIENTDFMIEDLQLEIERLNIDFFIK